MSWFVATANIVLGLVYTSYGIMTIVDLKRGWRTSGLSHFGLAWVAMAFTCGPHHLDHGLHVKIDGYGGPLDLFVVLAGFPAGVSWFLLRVEALAGGRGDRYLSGTPRWVSALPALTLLYVAITIAAVTDLLMADATEFGPRYVPNLLLLGIYTLIGYYLLRTQLQNRQPLGGWSVSGLALTLVFPTCGVMHAVQAAYAITGDYAVDWHGLAIDWLAVPAAVYFVWVVRGLHLGARSDWNRGATGVRLADAPVAA
jgi:hypothetical protein